MWMDQECGALNKIATRGANLSLHSHAFAVGIGLWIESHGKIKLPLIIGFIVMIAATIYASTVSTVSTECSLANAWCDNHLKWAFDENAYLVVFLVAFFFIVLYVRPWTRVFLLGAPFILSYALAKYWKRKTCVASFWCYISVFTGILFFFFAHYSGFSDHL
jgi:hypothetical protein